MNQKNDKISVFQFAVLASFLGNGLFEGVGIVFLIQQAQQSAPIAALISLFISIIPFFMLIYVINYKPDKNIIEKIETLFNKKISDIINFILALLIFIILTFNIWIIVNFASIKYLSETPPLFLGIMFLIPPVYCCYKGIEAIARSSEFLLYIVLLFHVVITLSLVPKTEISNIFPLFAEGFSPVIFASLKFLTYIITPFIVLTIIPKHKIINHQKLKKYFFFGFMFSIITMVLVTFMIISIIGPDLATLYRFPAYYVMKKIQIIGVIENVENFFSTHWIFNMYLTICMCIFYLSVYVNRKFKISSFKIKNVIIVLIAIFSMITNEIFFRSSFIGLLFLRYVFPYLVGLVAFIIFIIIILKIYFNSKKKMENGYNN